ncbi:hypothetical protein MTR67_048862 [Solanum verrucosum]|uniref:Secreted protein n=1 Tax=Solanum verrucosum TaxID=315347 RepID=A0AAF0UZA2_SOLVR|nr:hypothetical protein MTR67_048862 [Solanum verrucosum]
MPGCCCFFAVALWVATIQQLELLPGGLYRWSGYCERRERGRGRATEDRREGGERGEEEGRRRLWRPRRSGFACREEKRKSSVALFFGEEEE